jgi:DNA mismatch repair protein MutS
MTETALILRAAGPRSLVIMDEVGRGTSTEDGLSIAWAVSEYLLDTLKCKTLFATHYHELTRLSHTALQLLRLTVREEDGNVIFLKKIDVGASDRSYGIHVARLAGIPESVILRAETLLSHIQTAAGDRSNGSEQSDGDAPLERAAEPTVAPLPKEMPPVTRSLPGLFSNEELVLDELLSVNPDKITALEALLLLSKWKKALCD